MDQTYSLTLSYLDFLKFAGPRGVFYSAPLPPPPLTHLIFILEA